MIACPSCRSSEVTIHEHFTVSSSICLKGGVAIFTCRPQEGDSQGKFSGSCIGCGHRWAAKYATGQAAIAAADIYEATEETP